RCRRAASGGPAAARTAELAEPMIGGRVEAPVGTLPRRASEPEVLLSVQELAAGGKLTRANFEVRRGEIFGIAGVSGNGQAQLADVLCGLLAPARGEVRVGTGRVAPQPHPITRARDGRVSAAAGSGWARCPLS